MIVKKNRGVFYAFMLGLGMPTIYVTSIGYLAASFQIPFIQYLSTQHNITSKLAINSVFYVTDIITGLIVALLFAYPLGAFGHGRVIVKIVIFMTSLYIGYFPPSFGDFVIILTDARLMIFTLLCVSIMYWAQRKREVA